MAKRKLATITARRLRRYEAAENVARAFRQIVNQPASAPVGDAKAAWETAMDWLIYWLGFSEKEFRHPPDVPPVHARWKHNREQAALGWTAKEPKR